MTESVTTMRNIGPRCAEWLAMIGIQTADDLRRLGAPTAYRGLNVRGIVKPHRMLRDVSVSPLSLCSELRRCEGTADGK